MTTHKVKKRPTGHAVYPKEGGKRVGTHPTKEGAKKQIVIIEKGEAFRRER